MALNRKDRDMQHVKSYCLSNLQASLHGELVFDSKTAPLETDPAADDDFCDMTDLVDILEGVLESDAQICPPLANFSFLNRCEGIDKMRRSEMSDDPTSQRLSEFAFDQRSEIAEDEDDQPPADRFDIFDGFGNPDDIDNMYSDEGMLAF